MRGNDREAPEGDFRGDRRDKEVTGRRRTDRTLLASIFRRQPDARCDLELVVVEGPERGARFPLDQPEILLGRGDPSQHRPSDILLDDHSVSSRHAIFTIAARRLTHCDTRLPVFTWLAERT